MAETLTTEQMWSELAIAGWSRRGSGSWHWQDPLHGVGEGPRLETPEAHAEMIRRQEEQANQAEKRQKARRRS